MPTLTLTNYIKRLDDKELSRLDSIIGKEMGVRCIPRYMKYIGYRKFKTEDLKQFICDMEKELDLRGECSKANEALKKIENYVQTTLLMPLERRTILKIINDSREDK